MAPISIYWGDGQPEIYGYSTLADVERDCRTMARKVNLELVLHQSNCEFEIIDFTHTSVAILDALNTFEVW